jgi:hypothetical protein
MMMKILMGFNTAFKQSTRRKQGEKFAIGFIKRKIELIVSNFPDGLKEPALRDVLRDMWGISEPKGVKTHLEDLEDKEKVLVKEEKKGFANVWKLSQEYEAFKLLVKEFHNSEDEVEFLKSKYAQSMINEEFVNHFAAEWWRKYASFFNFRYSKPIENLPPNKLMNEFYTRMLGLKQDDLIQILRVSPSSLNIFLFPEEILPLLRPGTPLDAYFLFLFVTDIMTHGAPDGKGIETTLVVDYGKTTKGKGGIKIAPSITARARFGIKSMKGLDEK